MGYILLTLGINVGALGMKDHLCTHVIAEFYNWTDYTHGALCFTQLTKSHLLQ